MSSPPEYDDGAYGTDAAGDATGAYDVHGAHAEGGAPEGPPNVYFPHPDASLSYDAYADPAAAHGWQNAYDETCELPQIGAGERGPAPVPAQDLRPVPAARPRAAGRGTRRKRDDRPNRRLMAAAGTAGAVAVAALVAGFSFSGSSGGAADKGDRTGVPAADRPALPTDAGVLEEPDADAPSGGGKPAATAVPSASPSPSVTAEEAGRTSPEASTSAPAVTPTETTASPTVTYRKPGRGPGGTKKPR